MTQYCEHGAAECAKCGDSSHPRKGSKWSTRSCLARVERPEEVKLDVTVGLLKVNGAVIYQRAHNVVAISVDLDSDYGRIFTTGSNEGVPVVDLLPNSRGLVVTTVAFPDFKGWNIWCCQIARSSLSVCLVRPL